jgi:CSLREA domain-containing protein
MLRSRSVLMSSGMLLVVFGLLILMQTTAQAVQTGTPRPPTITVSHTPFIPSHTPPPTSTRQPTPIPTSTPLDSDQILIVTKLADTDDGVCDSKDCSLREAIGAAAWGATINFSPGLGGTITLSKALEIRKSLTINGPGPKSGNLIISGSDSTRIMIIRGKIIVAISDVTIANGSGAAGDSGGIWNEVGTLRVINVTFQNNKGWSGGAIENSGALTVIGSTFVGNTAEHAGAIDNAGTMTVTNSTFYRNSARAGAIRNSGEAAINNSTFQANSDENSPSIIGNSKTTLRNTIIQGRSGSANCLGAIVDGGHNLQYPGGDCGKTIPLGDPKLGPLQDNGGPTWTMALQPGSAAIGKVPKSKCLPTDQRGMGRLNATCDIGAVQQDGVPLTATPTRNR